MLVSKPPPGDDDEREQLNKLKESSASHFNQHTRASPPLTAGQDVRVRNLTNGIWEPSTRSYTVKTTNGELRRKRAEIRTTREQLRPPPDPSTNNAAETTTHPVAIPVVTNLCSSPPATMQIRRSTRTIKSQTEWTYRLICDTLTFFFYQRGMLLFSINLVLLFSLIMNLGIYLFF